MVDSWRTVQIDAVVDLAGADRTVVELSMRRLRALLPLNVRLHSLDLSRCAIDSLELTGTHVAVIDPQVDLTSIAFDAIGSAVAARPETDLLYGQETHGPDRVARDIPRWSPERLRNEHYLPGLLVISRRVTHDLNVPTVAAPLHRWELALQIGEAAERVDYLATTLSHRRAMTTAEPPDTAQVARTRLRVLQAHCNRLGLRALAVHGPSSGLTRARRIMDGTPSVAIILPGPHEQNDATELLAATSDEGLIVIAVCAPGETPPQLGPTGIGVQIPMPCTDLGERIRWGLSACEATFVTCVPSSAQVSDPMWLAHLAGLLGNETVAAGPMWCEPGVLSVAPGGVEAEVDNLPLAGTVIRRQFAMALLETVGHRTIGWFDDFVSTGSFGANAVVSPDVRLALGAPRFVLSHEPEPQPAGWFRRPIRRLFPLPA
jgi:hypothetical protein